MLPIRKVVLYKHGVGYFERLGKVVGEAALDLHFRASEMNDVLKSLTTLDLTSGHIASISYESTAPLEKQLEDIAIRLPESHAVSGLLAEVKGARVAVEIAGERVEGVASGIETVARKMDDTVLEQHRLALFIDGSSLRTFDLEEVTRVEFLDEGLREDLQHLLQVLIDAKRKDLKRLTIFAQGEGERDILASYILETPVWKTSYRVLLGDDKSVIQGWALVDNTQDEDWVDVELSLVAGLPISFVHDLYSPRYKQRPVVEVREEAAYAPPILEQAEEEWGADELADAEPTGAMASITRSFARKSAAPRRRERAKKLEDARDRSIDVQTRTVEVGDLFEYAIENPVTVKRNQSALVPILQGPFDGKRVAVYNADVREKNPMSAILFHNTTGMTLEGGPVTVLEQETYVGESMLETMKPDEERIVPYSVELGCVVSVDHRSRREDVRQVRIVHGRLTMRRYRIEETIYVVKSKRDKPIDLFLEHRFRSGWDLIDTPDPVERTDNFYRFRFDVPARETIRFRTVERGDESEIVALTDVDREQVGLWLSRRYVDQATHDALSSLVDLQEQMADLTRKAQRHEEEIQRIFEDQGRQRENLMALGDSQQEKALREKYVAELSAAEERVRSLRQEVKAWRTAHGEAEKALRSRVRTMDFRAEL